MLSQSCEWKRPGCRSKVIQRRVTTSFSDLVQCPRSIGPACGGDTIEISVAGLDQTCIGPKAILGSAGVVEIVEDGKDLCRCELEDHSTVVLGSAVSCRPVEIPVAAL